MDAVGTYKDLLRLINSELGDLPVVTNGQLHNRVRLVHRMEMLRWRDDLELAILKRLGWA